MFVRRKATLHLGCRQQRHDPTAVNDDRMMLEHRPVGLDRDDPACIDDQINRFHVCGVRVMFRLGPRLSENERKYSGAISPDTLRGFGGASRCDKIRRFPLSRENSTSTTLYGTVRSSITDH